MLEIGERACVTTILQMDGGAVVMSQLVVRIEPERLCIVGDGRVEDPLPVQSNGCASIP